MNPAPLRHRTIAQIFIWPLVVGILSTVGLLSALLGNGFWDGVSWVTLAIPVVLYVGFSAAGLRAPRTDV